mmetsp:Transcript_90205/g.160669  ORF Transcript_90205/g.160669 Transcript_90205/m.160669 type:complete len:94 (-) Transcript_90205:88-369(-)
MVDMRTSQTEAAVVATLRFQRCMSERYPKSVMPPAMPRSHCPKFSSEQNRKKGIPSGLIAETDITVKTEGTETVAKMEKASVGDSVGAAVMMD